MIHPEDYGIILAIVCMLIFFVLVAIVAYGDKPAQADKPADQTRKKHNEYTRYPDTHVTNQNISDGPWEILRQKVLERDGNKCTMCGESSQLQVDHIQELSLGGKNELSNLRTLCIPCHEDRHGRQFTREEYYADRRYGENYKLNPKVKKLLKNARVGTGIKYKDRNAHYSERVIHTQSIWSDPKTHRVYVKAYDELDDDVRIFKLSRMKLCDSRLNYNAEDGKQSDSDEDIINQWLKRNNIN